MIKSAIGSQYTVGWEPATLNCVAVEQLYRYEDFLDYITGSMCMIYMMRCFATIAQHATHGTVAEPEEKLLAAAGGVVQLYRTPGMSESQRTTLLKKAQAKVNSSINDVDSELCFNVSLDGPLSSDEARTLSWYDL